jgi:hypothetical protein
MMAPFVGIDLLQNGECPPSRQVETEIAEARSRRRGGPRNDGRDIAFAEESSDMFLGAKSPNQYGPRHRRQTISKKVGMGGASDKRTRLSSPSLYAPCSQQREYSSRCQNSELNLIAQKVWQRGAAIRHHDEMRPALPLPSAYVLDAKQFREA